MSLTILSDREILELLRGRERMITNFVSLEDQIQPSGFDLTLRSAAVFSGQGTLGKSGERTLSALQGVKPRGSHLELGEGSYLVRYNEHVSLPLDVAALVLPRSSLMRMGVTLHTAVWDPGYRGRGVGLLAVHNTDGVRIEIGSRIAQMIFMVTSRKPARRYGGTYQDER